MEKKRLKVQANAKPITGLSTEGGSNISNLRFLGERAHFHFRFKGKGKKGNPARRDPVEYLGE